MVDGMEGGGVSVERRTTDRRNRQGRNEESERDSEIGVLFYFTNPIQKIMGVYHTLRITVGSVSQSNKKVSYTAVLENFKHQVWTCQPIK